MLCPLRHLSPIFLRFHFLPPPSVPAHLPQEDDWQDLGRRMFLHKGPTLAHVSTSLFLLETLAKDRSGR